MTVTMLVSGSVMVLGAPPSESGARYGGDLKPSLHNRIRGTSGRRTQIMVRIHCNVNTTKLVVFADGTVLL